MRGELRPEDYEYRTKRNRNLINTDDDGEIATGINWGRTRPSKEPNYYEEEPEEYNNEELVEEYEEMEEESIQPMMIGKKPINLDKLKIKKQQQEMEKITIYLDKNLITILKMLKKDKRINSYSQCIKEALQKYLTRD